jgi:hypothetical protein
VLPSNYLYDFALYFSILGMFVYTGLTLHVPHAFYLYPTGNVGHGYYIGVRFGDMAIAFFAITFAEVGDQLPSSFRLLHLIFLLVKRA